MPAEMRHFDRRTEPAIPEVEKLMTLRNYLDSPSVQRRGGAFEEIVIQSIWPDMNQLDAELIRDGFIFLDSIEPQVEPPKQEELPN